jgi:hypothetical protein
MKCKHCQSNIPAKRISLGYKTCVNFSTTESYGFVNVINHKTGNTVQIMPKEQAAAINKIGDRKRFGTVLRGGSKSTAYNPKKLSGHSCCSTSYIGTKETYEMVGKEAMQILEHQGFETALKYIEKQVNEFLINKLQASDIKRILMLFN